MEFKIYTLREFLKQIMPLMNLYEWSLNFNALQIGICNKDKIDLCFEGTICSDNLESDVTELFENINYKNKSILDEWVVERWILFKDMSDKYLYHLNIEVDEK